jgi:hypothetical protein
MLVRIIEGFIIVAAGGAAVCLFLSRLRKARDEHQKLNLDGP